MKPTRADVEEVDREGLYRDYESWPEQAEQALKIKVPPIPQGVEKIVYCGMGGSGCAGDILQDLSNTYGRIPIYVVKDYHTPRFADPSTLVLAVSYSGDTEETLSALKEALERGCKIVGISGGGRLEEICAEEGIPHIKLGGALTPRSALPYILYSSLNLLGSSGYRLTADGEVERSIALMRTLRESIGLSSGLEANEAKQIANHLRIPLVYGPHEIRGALIRCKNSLNENAKTHALIEILPEACHNDIEAWRHGANNIKVLFTYGSLDRRMQKRFSALAEFVKKTGYPSIHIAIKGSTPLGKIMSTLYTLEYATLYLAVLKKIPPAPTPNISQLKKRLSEED